jgi:hypothetical protein
MDALTIFFICAGIIGLNLFRSRFGFPSHISLLPFQGGVFYRRGRPVREVGPGRHRVFMGNEKIIMLDKRPTQVNIENRAVVLADGATVVYSFSASAEVRDVKKAIYASTNYTQLPAFVTICAARGALNRSQTDQIRAGQAALTEEVSAQCRSRLAEAGFDLLSFRFTQMGFAATAPQAECAKNSKS